MSQFNKAVRNTTKTTNLAGGEAYTLSSEEELYCLAVTETLSNKYYETAGDRVTRLRSLVKKVQPKFVAQLAIYARQKMYLRSIPLVLAVELAKVHNGDSLVSRMLPKIILRADELTELLAYFAQANDRDGQKKLGQLPNQFYKGLRTAFNNFTEFDFAKYNRDGAVKLRDVMFLIHAKPKDGVGGFTRKVRKANDGLEFSEDSGHALLTKLTTNTLETPYTWEVELSKLGQQKFADDKAKVKAFKAKWEELIDSKKVGYMATLRNLRNMLQSRVDGPHLDKVAEFLSNEDQVKKSRQFPFRFLSAYREIKNAGDVGGLSGIVLEALEQAAYHSGANIKGFDSNTSVFLSMDTSGSMSSPIGPKTVIQCYDIGFMLGMLLQSRCKNVIGSIFAEGFKVVNLPRKNVLRNADELHNLSGAVGHSTNGYLVIEHLLKKKMPVDKVMIFTDCQLWDSYAGYGGQRETIANLWNKYKVIAPKARLYLFDLAGHGTSPVSTHSGGVNLVAGWNAEVFNIMDAIENGSSAVAEIKKIEV